jgi:hypothetical protein
MPKPPARRKAKPPRARTISEVERRLGSSPSSKSRKRVTTTTSLTSSAKAAKTKRKT